MANLSKFTAILTDQYTKLFSEDPEYAFSAARTTPADLAAKITEGLIKGTANKEGKGVKNTCKILGIPYTYKDIKNFLLGEEKRK